MKKISKIEELKKEKQRLYTRRAELEKAILYDWRDVKDSLRPKNVVKQVLHPHSEEEEGVLPGLVTEMATYFTRKLVGKASGNLIGKFFKK